MFLFFSSPFKAVAAGSEQFGVVMFMSISSTLTKALMITSLFYFETLTLTSVAVIFASADALEALTSLLIFRRKLRTPFQFFPGLHAYKQLVKDALPQIGVVLFSSALARMDWIFIGLFLSASSLAEYSFAYKAFELSTLPLLAIAPLLVPYFTRLIRKGYSIDRQENIRFLLRMEMIIAGLAALCINLLWIPVIDAVTEGKYGATNAVTIFILSASLPWLYWNNFLWSIHFSYGRLKIIFASFVLTFVLNVAGNLFLIPALGNEGAALSYFISIAAQTIFYAHRINHKGWRRWEPLIFCSACALCSGLILRNTPVPVWGLLPLGILLYSSLLICTIQVRKTDWLLLRKSFRL
jgi:O-antigen/teichoic acid export membrane protein